MGSSSDTISSEFDMRINKIKLVNARKSERHLRADSVEGLSIKS